jgi:thymidylate synthase
MWSSLVNDDGSINSNYGQYIFAKKPSQKMSQFENVIKGLTEDKDSRRASITILSRDHLLSNTKDLPCTYSLNFRIRDDKLNMSVHMRSQDAVFGMGNDAPCFSFIHEMIYGALTAIYQDLVMGEYYHVVDSFHVYERHFEVMEKIATGDKYLPITCPEITGSKEVKFLRTLIHLTYKKPELAPLPKAIINAVKELPELSEIITEKIDVSNYNFSRWLTTFDIFDKQEQS